MMMIGRMMMYNGRRDINSYVFEFLTQKTDLDQFYFEA